MSYMPGDVISQATNRKNFVVSVTILWKAKDMQDQIEELKDKIIHVLRKHGVKKAALFGSITKGEATEKSDIDLLVEFEGRKSLLDLVGLKLELEELLKREVDILTYRSLHPLLKERILHEQEVIL